jgi:hypothetical protein
MLSVECWTLNVHSSALRPLSSIASCEGGSAFERLLDSLQPAHLRLQLMKTTCILILCGLVSARILAQSQPSPATAPAVSQPTNVKSTPTKLLHFPKTFTNSSGTVYREVKLQQVYSYGIGISYVTTNNMTQGGYVSYNDLSPELQKKLGYDPKATGTSPTPKSLDQLRREYIDVADPRKGEALAEQARIEKEMTEEERMRAALRRDISELNRKAAQK